MPKGNKSSEEEEQPSTSTQSTPSQKKDVHKPVFSSPLKKGETADIWTWPKYKTQLPVTCGDKKATLYRDKLARGEDCLQAGDQWFTPAGFEEFGGKNRRKNWKTSIRCEGTTLEKLIQEGYLTSPIFKIRKTEQSKRELFPSNQSAVSSTDSEHEANDKEEAEQEWEEVVGCMFESDSIPESPDFPFYDSAEEEEAQKEQETGNRKRKMSKGNERDEEDSEHKDHEEDDEEVEVEQEREEGERGEQTTPAGGGTSPGGSQVVPQKTVFQVTCGVIDGMLHKDRFASGTCGKSIRTELSWMTPMEFLMEGSVMAETSWKKDILCDGNPLSVLIKNKDLIMHPLLCDCKLCKTGDLQDQIKDDDCFICRSQGNLICCEECPRSFHQGCHLPNLNNAMLRKDLHWVCTFCILRNSQSWRQPSKKTYQEVLNYRTSEHLLECQYLLLCLYHTDEDQIFVKNPCIKVRNYSSVIETPMWLDEVAAKLQNSQYQTVKAFVADVLLIFTNCAAFKRDNAETLKNNAETLKDIAKTLMDNAETAERLKDVFKGEFKKAFSL